MGRGIATVLLVLAAAWAQEVDDPVATALDKLQSDAVRDRVRAARALGKLGGEAAVAGLRAALKDKEELVRVVAAASLVKLKAEDTALVDVLTPLLRSEDWYTRWQACLSLGAMGPRAKAAVPALINAANHAELDVSQEAAQALARIAPDDPAVHNAFIDMLSSGLKIDRAFLLRRLETVKDATALLPGLEEEFLLNQHRLRAQAYRLLLKQGKKATPTLIKGLESDESEARTLSAEGLLHVRDASAAPALLEALGDEDPRVREVCAQALGVLESKEAVDKLIALLRDKEARVRHAAAGACASIGKDAKRAGPSIVRLLATPDRKIDKPVRTALKKIGFDSLEWFLGAEWVAIPGAKPRWRVSFLDSHDGGAGAYVDGLKLELDDNSHGPAMIDALKTVLDESSDAALVELLGSKSDTTRQAAAYLLGLVARDKAVAREALEKATLDVRAPVRDAAKASLKNLAEKAK